MFFKYAAVVVLLRFVSVAFSALSHSGPSVHPDHPGKCWDSFYQQPYSLGSTDTTPGCRRVTCYDDYSLRYASCGAIGTEPPCYIVAGDLSLSYPDCCPKGQCPEE